LPVLGQPRDFCCTGCVAVAQLIVSAGHEDYYEYRQQQQSSQGLDEPWREWAEYSSAWNGSMARQGADKATTTDYAAYDDADLQRQFVQLLPDNQREAHLLLEGVRCAACVWLNEQFLGELDGVVHVSVDYASGQMRIRWDGDKTRLSALLQAVESLGYRAFPFDASRRTELNQEARRKGLSQLIFALILSMEVMAHAIATYTVGGPDATGQLALWERIGRWTDLVVVTAMLVYVGADFYRSAWRDLKNRHLGMDVPIVLGLSVAFVASAMATWQGQGHVYFDSIAMFLTLMMAARYFELKARLKAAASFDRLMKIIPATVRRVIARPKTGQVSASPEEEEVSATKLKEGDLVRVLAGESVAVDGVLQAETGLFNESHLTGEAMPVRKCRGDRVTAGSVAVDQPVVVRVTSPAAASTLTRLVEMASRGAALKPELAQLADRIARWFVPVVISVAGGTYLWWQHAQPELALPVAIAVLIVTCPCALGLATPVVLSLAASSFSRRGILPLDARGIEELTRATLWAFDKTGTLTEGKPRLVNVLSCQADKPAPRHKAEWLAIARSLEAHSSHPLAQAFLAESNPLATDANRPMDSTATLPVSQHKNVVGEGIEARIKGKLWRIGSLPFCGVDASTVPVLAEAGQTLIALSVEGQPQCLFVVADPLRPGVKESLARLRKQTGARMVLVSGDAAASVKTMAEALGFDDWRAEAKPEDKLHWLESCQKRGECVAFVGDGINDAPVLAAANASVSFAEATDLAKIHSHFVLLRPDFRVINSLHELSCQAVRLMRQNFSWALAYNALAIPLAMTGQVPPWLAALGMSLSSALVIGNSLRLKTVPGSQSGVLSEPGEST